MWYANPRMDNFGQKLLNHWPIIVVGALLFILAVVMIITFLIAEKRDVKFRNSINELSSSVRVFVINVPAGSVDYFNMSSISNVRHQTLSQFYQQFPISEQKKVITWINSLTDPMANPPMFLETDIHDTKVHKQYFSMLQANSVDKEKQIIHLESYLLKYMTASRGNSSSTHGLSTMKDLTKAIESNSKKRGITACYRFLYKKIQDKDKEIDPVKFNQIKNAIFPFLQGYNKRFLLQADGNDLIFSDLHVQERAKSLYLLHSVRNSINRYLSINGIANLIDIRIGVVEHSAITADGATIISQAKKTAEIAFEDKNILLWYEKGKEAISMFNDSSYRTEVERIINEKKLNYYFRPIYSVDKAKTIGYFCKSEPKDTYFDSMEELKDYALRTEDDRDLFATVAKNTLPLFVSERQSELQMLFYPVRIEERGYMLTVFARILKSSAAHIVFLFEENDIRNALANSSPEMIVEDMRLIRAKGYEVGLLLKEGELLLPPEIYSAFDYFICEFAFAGSAAEMDALNRSRLHGLVEKLLKYRKPIIATDIEGWPSIELLVRSGVRYISSESFAPYDPMILPLPPKSVRRINDFKK